MRRKVLGGERRTQIERLAGIDMGPNRHYDPDQSAQERLAKYQDRIALIGVFAEPEQRSQPVLQTGLPGPGELAAAHTVISLGRRNLVGFETTIGIRSVVPPMQMHREAALQHSVDLLRVAVGSRYDATTLSGVPLRIAQEGFQTPAQAAHAALDTVLKDFEIGLDAMHATPSLEKTRILVVSDPAYIAQTFGDLDPSDLQNGSVCGLDQIGDTADANHWVALSSLPLRQL